MESRSIRKVWFSCGRCVTLTLSKTTMFPLRRILRTAQCMLLQLNNNATVMPITLDMKKGSTDSCMRFHRDADVPALTHILNQQRGHPFSSITNKIQLSRWNFCLRAKILEGSMLTTEIGNKLLWVAWVTVIGMSYTTNRLYRCLRPLQGPPKQRRLFQ